ncbi:hypothetical protein [Methanobacterium sp.]|nr:hypothetical protein [Methanobacterium sp.]
MKKLNFGSNFLWKLLKVCTFMCTVTVVIIHVLFILMIMAAGVI